MEHAFVARFGNTVIKGSTFVAVGDELQQRGFVMELAETVSATIIKVPHSKPGRAAAKVEAKRNGKELNGKELNGKELKTEVKSVEVAAAEETHTAVMAGAQEPVGLQTRDCGVVHPDGVVCFIPVLYEARTCACGDRVFEHDGPHEAVTDDGVRYRWREILVVEDLPYNAYGPMEEELAE